MRLDSHGLFWEDTDYKTEKKQTLLTEEGWVQVFPGFWAEEWKLETVEDPRTICMGLDSAYKLARANKTGEKRTPPEPVWLAPDYLPGLEEARAFNIPQLTDDELVDMAHELFTTGKKHKLVFDIECYGNYFLIAFISLTRGKVTYLELSDDSLLNIPKLQWIFDHFCVIGFNSNSYDINIASMAVHGCSTAMMKSATSAIIEQNERGWDVLRHYKVKKLKCDHIDIVEVAPLFASLKIYGGRMHTRRMQDLPFHPDTVLTEPQRAIVRWYCVNDLRTTVELHNELLKELALREEMGREYGTDLRSKSDAQIAEAVIGAEVEKLNHCRAHSPTIDPGTVYRYRAPAFLQFRTPLMQGVLNTVCNTNFIVSEFGNIGLPEELKEMSIRINQSVYTLRIGGLHSTEKSTAHFAGPNTILKDVDVTSYYPYIILNLGLYPHHLGPNFLIVFRDIVERRVEAKNRAKHAKDAGDKDQEKFWKTIADSLKIVINGTYGKLGSAFSILYSPDLLIQVTLTGQLSLLLLIERLELAGIPVVSANTDGIVIKCPKHMESMMDEIVAQWERDTGFDTEETLYKALFSRDVNNYIAVKDPTTWREDDELEDRVKTKGVFAKPGLSKNPQNEICVDAIKELLINNKPIEQTIRGCNDITKFVNVRTVKGGAVKLYEQGQPGTFLGKAIRWYYGKDIPGEIVYAKSGNKVPKSDGAQPLMDLPDVFPSDVDYEWYERETLKILKKVDYAIAS
jgi:hypothetical protein